MAIVRMTTPQARKLLRFVEWMKVSKAVKRYINEGNDSFSVAIGNRVIHRFWEKRKDRYYAKYRKETK